MRSSLFFSNFLTFNKKNSGHLQKKQEKHFHRLFIRRCCDLARHGRAAVGLNPCVGALFTAEGRILAEGHHRAFGQPHAEVEVFEYLKDRQASGLPADATLYVSLEPCAHYGKTPPCADRIIREGVRQVVIASLDPNPLVNGKGVDKLRAAGVEVLHAPNEGPAEKVLRPFTAQHRLGRPYILLKWAQSADGFLGHHDLRTPLSGPLAARIVHKWRSEFQGIMVGTDTVMVDDPALSNRLYFGPTPVRITIDRHSRLPRHLRFFDGSQRSLVFTWAEAHSHGCTEWIPLVPGPDELQQMMRALLLRKIGSVMVEGGAELVTSFIKADLWDECRIIISPKQLHDGVPAPWLDLKPNAELPLDVDRLAVYTHPQHTS